MADLPLGIPHDDPAPHDAARELHRDRLDRQYGLHFALFEIIVFALIFGWLAVFIRFLGVAGEDAARA